MDCKVIDQGRRCLRLATMRLPYIFMFLLLFSAGGLLLLLHLQYLTETLHEQTPGDSQCSNTICCFFAKCSPIIK
ncbi:carbohydrate sulfotransferase 8 isoform X1 [Tachysurus ichikawai]